MKFVREEELKDAFIRMVWKLHVGRNEVLKPFINSLRGYDNKEKFKRYTILKKRIEQNSRHVECVVLM